MEGGGGEDVQQIHASAEDWRHKCRSSFPTDERLFHGNLLAWPRAFGRVKGRDIKPTSLPGPREGVQSDGGWERSDMSIRERERDRETETETETELGR